MDRRVVAKRKKQSVKATEKTTKKTTIPALVPRPDGRGALRAGGTPGNAGGTGRPPDAWKALCRDLASSDAVVKKAKEVVEDPQHPAWLGAWKFLAEQGYGKPKESVEHSGTVDLVGLLAGSFPDAKANGNGHRPGKRNAFVKADR